MPKKLTIEEARAVFKAEGCELLETTYVNSSTPMTYACVCGNTTPKISLSNFKKGVRCKRCGTQRSANKQKYKYEEVAEFFRKEGCTLLSEVYENNGLSLDYICSCGNTSKIILGNFLRGVRCMDCGIRKLSGENNPNWNPDKETRYRNCREYRVWRTNVLKRDDYTCQKCGAYNWAMTVHHVVNFSENSDHHFDEDNGITLCRKCHCEFHTTHGFKRNNGSQLTEFLTDFDCEPWYAGEREERCGDE